MATSTAGYNHGLPAVLKNALDYAYAEYDRKPATFVGYGSPGAALRPLMRWFVLRLFADLFFRPDDLIEPIAVVGLETLFASGHSFVARRQ
jgi:NADPH-dependent FMN reductase